MDNNRDFDREIERIRAIENTKEYQDRLNLLRNQMSNNLFWKRALPIVAFFAIFIIVQFKVYGAIAVALLYFFVYLPQSKKRKQLFNGKQRTNEEIFTEDFLDPVLKEIFPNVSLNYHGGYPIDILKFSTPNSKIYNQFCLLAFNDASDLTVCNLHSYHQETRTRTVGSSTETYTVDVTDFDGQVFSLRVASNLNGYIRVVPTKKSFFLKREVQHNYPKLLQGEVKIDTEDINHNENYNIYCTDELSARKFLSPRVLEWFDNNISQNAVSMFVNSDRLYISLNTKYFLFMPPTSFDQIKQLSMVEEYKKLRMAVDYIRNFTKIFQIQE